MQWCSDAGHEAGWLWAQWMVLVLCVIMDIHPRVRMPSLMELRLGILCNVQAHFPLTHIPLGWHDPNETPAFPRWQWAMLLHSVRAGERGDPSLPSGLSWKKSRRPHRLAHLLHTHTLSCTLITLRGSSPLSRKFWHEQLLRVREWQVYSRFQQAQRGEAGWQLSGITTRVEAVCWTKWAACLPASLFPPQGFLDERSASPWMFTHH